jgi:hypothetical protein
MRYPGAGADSSTAGMPQIRQTGGKYDFGRSVAPQYVEDAISTSKGVVQDNGNTVHDSGTLRVVLNPDEAVVTVITQ